MKSCQQKSRLSVEQLERCYRKSFRKSMKENWACSEFAQRKCLELKRCWRKTKAAKKKLISWGTRPTSIKWYRKMSEGCSIYQRIHGDNQFVVYDAIERAGDFSPLND